MFIPFLCVRQVSKLRRQLAHKIQKLENPKIFASVAYNSIFIAYLKLLNLTSGPTEILTDRTEARQRSLLKVVKIAFLPQFRAGTGSGYEHPRF